MKISFSQQEKTAASVRRYSFLYRFIFKKTIKKIVKNDIQNYFFPNNEKSHIGFFYIILEILLL